MIRRATRPQPNRPPPSSSSSSSKSFSSSVREWPKIRSARRAPFELVGWLRFCGQEQDRFVNAKGLADGSQPQNYRNAAKPGRGAVPRPRDSVAALQVGSRRKPSGQAGGSRERPSALICRASLLTRQLTRGASDRTAESWAMLGSRLLPIP
jgi:hypothetical protein